MKKRIIALLLSLVMLTSLLTPTALATEGQEPETTQEEVKTPDQGGRVVEVPAEAQAGQEVTVEAPEEGESYQWQFQLTEDLWVSISGDEGQTIALTYAKICNMLDENGKASLRCLVDGQADEPYTVVLTESQDVSQDETLDEIPDEISAEEDPVPEEDPVLADASEVAISAVKSAAIGAAPLAEDGEEPGKKYTILIKYVFENGKMAAPSWAATLGAGTAYKGTVTSPEVVGYEPDQMEVELNYASVEADETIIVTYKEAMVNFNVVYHYQNIQNDEYTAANPVQKEGRTNSKVGVGLDEEQAGFKSLQYDPELVIAADGSTVVDIYYDRMYYLVTFDLDGGYGVEPIYARYGTPIGDVGTPTKPGYTFTGWDKEIPKTMPAQNTSYKANWTAGDAAKVTIVVWGENADDEQYSFYHNSEIMAKPGEKLTLKDLQGKLICGKEEHTHSSACGINCSHAHDAACYGGTKQEDPIDGKTGSAKENIAQFKSLTGGKLENGMVYRVKCDGATMTRSYDKYYLYYNNAWYLVSSKDISGSAVKSSQKVNAHDHSRNWDNNKDQFWVYNSKLSCAHTHHDDSCYACGIPEHKHTSACYYNTNTSFMENPKLWKLVRSDEVTVAADGTTIINVYYDRVEFTLHFRKANSSRDDYGTIKAKWGADIRNQFNAKSKTAGTSNWSKNRDASDPWTSYLDIMPEEDQTFYAYKASGKSTAYYYVEGLDGNDELYYTNVSTGTGFTVTEEEFIDIDGFTFNAGRSAKVGADFNGAKFYYTRNSYTLKFFNRTEELTDKAKTVKYEAPLKDYYFEPAYPSDLEPNAYVFDGWYTTAGCYEGSEANLETMTMPASDVILYAKWTPKTHTVMTWLTNEMKTPVNVVGDSNVQTVSHGSLAQKPDDPTNGKYNFVGWFYKEDGKEKAFDFSMQVRKDLELYAKWTADALVEYTIRYQTENGDDVAQPTVGKALAGADKTFTAKGGDELFESFQTGFFPKVSSHSLNMSIDGVNEYTFVYVQRGTVPYTVRYLTDAGKMLFPDEEKESSNAIVTENFKPKPGWIPDEPQKRIVLEADGENVITFVYHQDDENAFVQVIYWFQNIVGEDYTESPQKSYIAKIGSEITEEAKAFEGFQYNEEKSTNNGTLTSEGLVLNLYYDRIEYPYLFKFVDEEGNEIIKSEAGQARFGRTIDQRAKEVPGYTLESDEVQSIKIAIEDPADTAKKNVKIFYYKLALADLTISKQGCEDIDENQSFIFTVTGGDLPNDGLKVVVKGNGSVTIKGLKVGTYTVTEESGWSWRYEVKSGERNPRNVEVKGGAVNEITFDNTREMDKWLNGCSWAVNNWASGKKKTDKDPNGETN